MAKVQVVEYSWPGLRPMDCETAEIVVGTKAALLNSDGNGGFWMELRSEAVFWDVPKRRSIVNGAGRCAGNKDCRNNETLHLLTMRRSAALDSMLGG